MARRHVLAALLLWSCKAELGMYNAEVDAGTPDSQVPIDAGADALTFGPWSPPAPVPGASSTAVEDDCTLSSNKLELYFKRVDGTDPNLYIMTRANEGSPWGTPTALTVLNTTTTAEESPRLSADDLTMYFGRSGEIYKTTRAAIGMPWTAPAAVTPLNTPAYEKWADVCDNGYAVVSRLVTNNGQDLFEGTVTGGAPTALTAFNSMNAEQGTLLSSDCTKLYFQTNRSGNFDIWAAERSSISGAWSTPAPLPDFNTDTFGEEDPWISKDGRTFVFASNSAGTKDLYITTR